MKVGQIGPTLLVPEKTVNFFWVKPVVPSFILKMRKVTKNQHVYMHTHTRVRKYVMVGGKYGPPESNRVKVR